MKDKFLSAEWRYLAMLNYEIDPAILQPYLPPATELDIWNGHTFISVVAFLFLKTRLLGLPVPFHTNFEEVNLRFYVRHRAAEGWRRGVVFIKEIVPRFAIATIARLVYNENYVAMPMRHRLTLPADPETGRTEVAYGWQFNRHWNDLWVAVDGSPQPLQPGSQAEFITEHYWGYAAQKDGGCVEYRVEHPPWRVWPVSDYKLDCDILGLYGKPFVEALQAPPASAFLAEGSPVIVRQGLKLDLKK